VELLLAYKHHIPVLSPSIAFLKTQIIQELLRGKMTSLAEVREEPGTAWSNITAFAFNLCNAGPVKGPVK
jgi:hypothetical protein